MSVEEDPTPLPQLNNFVHRALLALDLDCESALWPAFVRAAVRRTQHCLFVLFRGNVAALEPCEALTNYAAAALEVVASENRPQLCLVPLFATTGWAGVIQGHKPIDKQAELLREIEVVFAANAPDAGVQQGNISSTSSDTAAQDSPANAKTARGRGRVIHHRRVISGSSGGVQHNNGDHIKDDPAHGPYPNRRDSNSRTSGSTHDAVEPRQSQQPAEKSNLSTRAASDSFSLAVRLAEALTAARGTTGQAGSVAVGSLEPILSQGGEHCEALPMGSLDRRAWRHVAVGGTFDRLHAGHRILLAATAICATEAVYVGITGPSLLRNKNHSELLESYDARARAAKDYLRLVRPGLTVHTAELHNPKGLASEVEQIEALVVSTETAKGAEPINEDRLRRGFAPLQVVVVSLVGATGGTAAKLSSSTLRAQEAERLSSGSKNTKATVDTFV